MLEYLKGNSPGPDKYVGKLSVNECSDIFKDTPESMFLFQQDFINCCSLVGMRKFDQYLLKLV